MYTLEFNDDETLRALDRLSDGLGDLSIMMQDVAEFLVTSTKDRFGEGTAPDGTPWAPKSQTTLDAYAARHDRVDARPLFGPSGMLSQRIFAETTADSVRWGSPMIYAAVMQFGAEQGEFGAFMGIDKRGRRHFHTIPWGDIPARPFLGLSETDRDGITAIANEYVEMLLQGN